MLWIYFGILLLVGVGLIVIGRKRLPAVCVGAAFLLLGAAVGLLGAGVIDMGGDPAAVGETFFYELGRRDYLSAAESVRRGDEVCVHPQLQAEGSGALYEALMDGYGCTAVGEVMVNGIYGTQTVELTSLDLSAVASALPQVAEEILRERIDGSPKAEVFDENGAYLPHISTQVYEDAAARIAEDVSPYLTVETVELTYVWGFGGWKLTEDLPVLQTVNGFDAYAAETARQVTEGLPLLKKHYRLDAHATVGQVPDPAAFGSTKDPMVVQAVVDRASDLLAGQTLSWNPHLNFRPDGEIHYYYDETILAIVWQEIRNFAVVTFAEVKLADASQLVRRLSNDTLGDFKWQYPTTMAKQSNAVVALSADFYMTRVVGVSVYQGRVFRNEPVSLDHCFVDYEGNLVLVKNKELPKSEIPQFVKDNNINFAVDFGPVLIRDGEKQKVTMYGIGEVNEIYARSSIGQVGELHYILMTINGDSMYGNAGTIQDSINYMYEKNCIHAYALDGGKTATMVFNGSLANRPKQRTLSDMICFVSAVPENER